MYKHLKPGVAYSKDGITLDLLDGLLGAAHVYGQHGYDFVVTSLGDGVHKENSLHYVGRAADLRVRHVPAEKRQALLRAIRAALTPQYDVILESDHIHLEYDPK